VDKTAAEKLKAVLRRRGFDRCRVRRHDGGRFAVRVGCSQCQALCVNGTACHEAGCPNQKGR
jgi:hypothetical protein